VAGAPIWTLGLLSGVLFGAAMTVWTALQDGDVSWAVLIVLGVLSGAGFGIGMGWFLRRELGEFRDELAGLPLDQRRAVLRSTARGPAPADPAVRAAALRQAQRSRELLERRSRFNLIVFTVGVVGYALLALTQSPWWWLAFAMFAGFLTVQLAMRRRIDRRIDVLSS